MTNPLDGHGYIRANELAAHTGISALTWLGWARRGIVASIKLGPQPRRGTKDTRPVCISKDSARALIEDGARYVG